MLNKYVPIALLSAVLSLTLGVSVAAAASTWTANPGTTFEDGVVTLNSTGQALGTSYENADLDVAVQNGDIIAFEYKGACGGGAPRVFIQGGVYNTWDPNPAQCPGTAVGDDWYLLVGTVSGIVNGTAGHTGIVNDNTSNPGVVLVRNVTIGGVSILPADVEEPSEPSAKDDCKNGGWQDMTRADGSSFKNQGLCIKYANTGK
jgi:hypothetical protein